MLFTRLTKIFVLISIFSTAFSNNLFLVEPYSVCVILAILSFLISLLRRETAIDWKKQERLLCILGIIVFLCAIGAVYIGKGIHLYEVGTLVMHAALFFLLYIHATQDRLFLRRCLRCIAASTGVVVISYMIGAHSGWALFFDSSAVRFSGFFHDPNYYALFLIAPLILLIAYSLTTRGVLQLLCIVLAAVALGSFLWSGSRGGFMGLCIGLVVCCMLTGRAHLVSFRILLFTIGVTVTFSILLLPGLARDHIMYRTQSITTSPTALTDGQERGFLWKQGLHAIAHRPLGYGLSYTSGGIVRSSLGDSAPVHNLYLQIALSGGILLLIVVLLSLRTILKTPRQHIHIFGLYAGFIGVLVASIFLDTFTTNSVWMLAGTVFAARAVQ